jgi:hypothetical protein
MTLLFLYRGFILNLFLLKQKVITLFADLIALQSNVEIELDLTRMYQ